MTNLSFLHNLINIHVRLECEKSGHVCPYWVNEQIMEDLRWLDEKDQGNRAEIYINQCHSIYLIYRPNDENNDKIFITCRRNNLSTGDYYGSDCNYCNKEVAKKLQKHFEKNGLVSWDTLDD